MPRHRQRVCLESGFSLDINKLIKRGWITPSYRSGPFVYGWTNNYTGERVASVCITSEFANEHAGSVRIRATELDQTILLVGEQRHFGGHQWYFLCPRQNRRVSVLWKPPGARYFACRQVWGRQVAYASQFDDRTNRAHRGKAKIRKQLIGNLDPDEWDLPPKPKWMRWKTYNDAVAKFEHYEAILNDGLAELLARLMGDDFFGNSSDEFTPRSFEKRGG